MPLAMLCWGQIKILRRKLQNVKSIPEKVGEIKSMKILHCSYENKVRNLKVVSPTHQLPLPPRKHSWYSFLLEAELTPGP